MPVESGDEDLGILHQKGPDDVFPDLRGGGGGQRHRPRRPKALSHLAEQRIVRPEVVPPVGDAVGFVDREKIDLDLRERFQKSRAAEPLGRDVDQLVSAGFDAIQSGGPLQLAQAGVNERRRDASRGELLHLILHQCNQRRDDEGDPGQHHRRKLIAKALSRAGRHHHDCIPPA